MNNHYTLSSFIKAADDYLRNKKSLSTWNEILNFKVIYDKISKRFQCSGKGRFPYNFTSLDLDEEDIQYLRDKYFPKFMKMEEELKTQRIESLKIQIERDSKKLKELENVVS